MESHPYQFLFPFLIIISSLLTSNSAYEDIHISVAPSISNPPAESPDSASPPLTTDPPSEFLPSPTDDDVVDPAVQNICDSTDYPDLCLSTVAPVLNGKTDIMSVLDAAINASAGVTSEALEMAKSMAAEPDAPDVYDDCKDGYDNALYNFQEAMDALPERDVGRMNSVLSAVITDVGDCEDELSGDSNPLVNYAEDVTKLASNCLAIVSLMP